MRTILAAAAALSMLAGSAALAAEKKPSAVLFKDIDGKGASIQVDDEIADLGSYGFNDVASSIFVISGKFEVCKDYKYKGTCQTFGQGLHNLPASLADAASSIRPVGSYSSDDGAILLFTDKDGNGKIARFTESIKNLADYPGFNDTVSSIVVFKGTWKACKSKDYGGSCVTLSQGAAYNLDSYNDSISSLKLLD